MNSYIALLTRRVLAVDPGSVAACADALPKIGELAGVASAALRHDALVIEYDLRRLRLAQIEMWLGQNGISLRAGFLRRFQRGLWKFTERNELENAAHPASGACCNHPPPGRP